MSHHVWINLPVADLAAAQAFYQKSGFLTFKEDASGPGQAAFVANDGHLYIMLFPQEVFNSFTQQEATGRSAGSEMLLSMSLASSEEVDDLITQIEQAGGTVYAEPGEHNGLYGAGFSDRDGHRWNFLVMDE